ncbi:hydantoinase/oxoprolinase family protein [Halovivax limisalsi]|uniref:hydantoinase/oxoprolinase family protein n=1 Tax=Halovivax limisalsi TaxID=1453760 RepID=UPI001FFDCC08|nr:hydantoinase/oxoprolinase family protein [Halovivax limisalsi]
MGRPPGGQQLGIDIGGTFTDVSFVTDATEELLIEKYLTSDDPIDTVERVLDDLESRGLLDLGACDLFTHATTLATNALLERDGAKTGMVTTEGFRDVVEMRDEGRYDIYDLMIDNPTPIPERQYRAGVPERVDHRGELIEELDVDELERQVGDLVDRGVESLAIAFLHSYANDENERRARRVVEEAYPDLEITTSSGIAPRMREYPRFTTAGVNAYVKPLLKDYLTSLGGYLDEKGFDGTFLMMTSGGGLMPPEAAKERPVQLLESGPTAGSLISRRLSETTDSPNLLAFDMGGTTSKGCLITDHELDRSYVFEAAREHEFKPGSGLPLYIPNVDLIEFSSGGGSIATIDARGTLEVGPESAGSNPGPASYNLGGTRPTITDADMHLGYLRPDVFETSDLDVDPDLAEEALRTNVAEELDVSVREAAEGIYRKTNENIANAFQEHAAEHGVDIREFSMLAFGGAGPIHAQKIADSLNIDRIIVPPNAGVLASLGLLVTPRSLHSVEAYKHTLRDLSVDELSEQWHRMRDEAVSTLSLDSLADDAATTSYKLDARFRGQGFDEEIEVPAPTELADVGTIESIFAEHYTEKYGLSLDRDVEITNIKLEVSAGRQRFDVDSIAKSQSSADGDGLIEERDVFFPETGEYTTTPFVDRLRLQRGDELEGPAVIEGKGSTTVVGPESVASIDDQRNIVITR